MSRSLPSNMFFKKSPARVGMGSQLLYLRNVLATNTCFVYITLYSYNCALHIVPSPLPLACHGIYFNCTIIIIQLYFACWYTHMNFMKTSLRFLWSNRICNAYHHSPHYVSYVNYFHLPYYDNG